MANVSVTETDDEIDSELESSAEHGNENDTSQQQQLTEEQWLAEWVKVEDGETKVFGFSSDKSKRRTTTHDFGKGPTTVMYFMVTTPEDGPDMEKEFRVTSKNLARQIIRYLNKGITELQITRHGKSMKDTEYEVVPVGENRIGSNKANQQRRL